ncbi:MAG: DUF2996 domain-containing protein [Okeania sp. SIO2G4]|uniref:DUF2996 domain-containing protein n=1 Tax=unclassified Okeania TaxID=2634635 RepID=UPI0013BC57E9|nr:MULTISPECIES: DUF2996 domain-containing protein [unclassified Okeania]NEP04470.1 DUF2996 domain-containing protein [Okeania sp. SIO4D6]NEP39586.1 DUF2996 domain-containing protein [Okeania sp. SIO2H7]NEP74861.1 DUF2996 domain-containing protein [Okeania sp. SIO2G5]NEP96774.1 DUF2996 domain-containing protein [Okeania sp. SIO2F5]NEQ93697.1 DUF2996 domain-containing protein [Okeania sp. SIO2G4]
MAEEQEAKKSETKPAGGKVKKEKPSAVEDKPFAEFIQQDYLPALQEALTQQGIDDLDLNLVKQKLPMVGLSSSEECWQVMGKFKQGQRQFNVYFPKKDIKGPRAFSCADNGAKPATLEPFLIDERKITLNLLVFGVIQRLNAQKWLSLN